MAMNLPSEQAKNRYADAFKSKVFEPLQSSGREGARYNPAGKRRDQSTAEMFGTYESKDLRACAKTFAPKADIMSARQKKLNFLTSEVGLAHSNYPPGYGHPVNNPRGPDPKGGDMWVDADSDRTIDPKMRRQMEQASELFGRETPAATHNEVHDKSRRLTPNNYKWFSHPEKVNKCGNDGMTHADRNYKEKCSELFDTLGKNPNHLDDLRQTKIADKQDDAAADQRRRSDIVNYSDLFGRETQYSTPEKAPCYHPKKQGHPEDRITVHQDWTDSKTELVCGSRSGKNYNTGGDSPTKRKSSEFNQSRTYHDKTTYQPKQESEPFETDNSHKIRGTIGMHTQDIHQAHLRTSLTSPEFYENASSTRHWEVVELHLSGLGIELDTEEQVRSLCGGFDLQIVKVALEIDPVSGRSKGRAKIMIRYNPTADSIQGLVQKLQNTRLRVEV